MATVRQINNGIIEKAKKTLQITYKYIVLRPLVFRAGPSIILNLFLNSTQK